MPCHILFIICFSGILFNETIDKQQVEQRDSRDKQEKDKRQRARVPHFCVLESLLIDQVNQRPRRSRRAAARHDVNFAENLKRADTGHDENIKRGRFRAIVKRGLLMQKSGGGGSTITQQLAKQLFSPRVENLSERLLQKPIEWVIAVRLERYYIKEEIINMYLNKFDFLHNAVGIQSAARVYFGQTPKTLKVEEAATLVGMCKNPSYYNPVRHKERTRNRCNTVLRQMKKAFPQL